MALLDIGGMQVQQSSHQVGCSEGTTKTQDQNTGLANGLHKQKTRLVRSDDFIDNLEALISEKTHHN